jgi:predicted acetyltransferase
VSVEIVPVGPEQASILANLLELYIHDFSEFLDLQIGDDGRFGYPSLDLYWNRPDWHPFFVRLDGRYAGLSLVKKVAEVWDMGEFFILRSCRRHGIGTRAAHEVWERFPGPWQVRVLESNFAACHFWAGAISKLTGEVIAPVRTESGGRRWIVFSFESGRDILPKREKSRGSK